MKELTAPSTSLSPVKRELLSLLMKKRNVVATLAEEIPRRVDADPCRLSFAQERMWFFEQVEPGTAVYNVPTAMRLEGPLDFDALQLSLNEIVRRHEALRTTFANVEGIPMQSVSQPMPLRIPVVDLRELPVAEREARAHRLAVEEARRPFDLAAGPLLRGCLVQLDTHDHVMLLTMHHIASDGWSTKVLIRELSVLYGMFSSGTEASMAELPIQYADFAHWQRQSVSGDTLNSQLRYWKQQLLGAPRLELPADHRRPAAQSFRGARLFRLIPAELCAALKELAQRQQVTLFMLLLATFNALLYRYTFQQEVVVGTPIANRTRKQVEGLIGFFVNTLVLRVKVGDNPGFRELIERVKEVSVGAYTNQDVPFEKVVDELQPERDLSRHPLFQVFFALNNNAIEPLELPRLSLSAFGPPNVTAKFDIEMSLVERENGIVTTAIYSTDLFEPITIEHMLEHYENLLKAIVQDPDRRLSDLALFSDEQEADISRQPDFQNSDQFFFEN